MNAKRMKMLSTILALILTVSLLGSAAADTIFANPGGVAPVNVDVSSKDAAFAIVTYTYDHAALQYQNTQFSSDPAFSGMVTGASDGKMAVAKLGAGIDGIIASVYFFVKADTPLGTYEIPFAASGVYNKDEKETQMTV